MLRSSKKTEIQHERISLAEPTKYQTRKFDLSCTYFPVISTTIELIKITGTYTYTFPLLLFPFLIVSSLSFLLLFFLFLEKFLPYISTPLLLFLSPLLYLFPFFSFLLPHFPLLFFFLSFPSGFFFIIPALNFLRHLPLNWPAY